MTASLRIFAALFAVHGLVHLLGVAAYWRLAEVSSLPYKTTIARGHWNVGDLGMRLFGGAFLIAALGFLAAAYGMWVDASWWRTALVGAAVLSLVVTALDWDVAYVGTVVDAVVIASIVIAARM